MATTAYIVNLTEPNNTTTKYRFYVHESIKDIASVLGFTEEDPAAPAHDAKKPNISTLLAEGALRRIRLGYRDSNKKLRYRQVYCVASNVQSALSGVINKKIEEVTLAGITTQYTITTSGIKTYTRLG